MNLLISKNLLDRKFINLLRIISIILVCVEMAEPLDFKKPLIYKVKDSHNIIRLHYFDYAIMISINNLINRSKGLIQTFCIYKYEVNNIFRLFKPQILCL